jgi:HSP20 family protein
MNRDVQPASTAPRKHLTRQEPTRSGNAALTPPVEVIEDAGGITLYADLPGVSRHKLCLHIEADTLTIDAESDLSVPGGLTSQHTEVAWRSFGASSP